MQTNHYLQNNYAFSPATSQKLLTLFLELPDGAQIISLRPLFHKSARKRADSLEAILDQGPKRSFGTGSVSWTHQGGNYYSEFPFTFYIEFSLMLVNSNYY